MSTPDYIDEERAREEFFADLEAEPGYPEYLRKTDVFNARAAARQGWIDLELSP